MEDQKLNSYKTKFKVSDSKQLTKKKIKLVEILGAGRRKIISINNIQQKSKYKDKPHEKLQEKKTPKKKKEPVSPVKFKKLETLSLKPFNVGSVSVNKTPQKRKFRISKRRKAKNFKIRINNTCAKPRTKTSNFSYTPQYNINEYKPLSNDAKLRTISVCLLPKLPKGALAKNELNLKISEESIKNYIMENRKDKYNSWVLKQIGC
ncbi:unnamed protein product [Moneuplotes crassus]|uniref:Uncharacterized protein n=1 Tax=Euplotes crassus TaxID=5936 RepID=A0AAD1XSK2_EUPCR|nr:unnamed protein product [Moneuplotes crassus]